MKFLLVCSLLHQIYGCSVSKVYSSDFLITYLLWKYFLDIFFFQNFFVQQGHGWHSFLIFSFSGLTTGHIFKCNGWETHCLFNTFLRRRFSNYGLRFTIGSTDRHKLVKLSLRRPNFELCLLKVLQPSFGRRTLLVLYTACLNYCGSKFVLLLFISRQCQILLWNLKNTNFQPTISTSVNFVWENLFS